MTSKRHRGLRALLAATALTALAGTALANGQGTIQEPPPPPPVQPPPPVEAAPPPPPPPPAPAPRVNWQGFYAGLHVGYAFRDENDDEVVEFDTNIDGRFGDVVRTSVGADAFAPGFCSGLPIAATPGAGCEEEEGDLDFGARVGYDFQSGSFVFGPVLEIAKIEASDAITAFSVTPATYTFRREINYMISLRLRAGVLLSDEFLIYATGGGAYGDLERSFVTSNATNAFTLTSEEDDDAWGWQAGGGLDYQLGGGTRLGIEYLYTRLDGDQATIRVSQGTALATNPFILVNPAGTDIRRTDDKFDFHTVRATLTFSTGSFLGL